MPFPCRQRHDSRRYSAAQRINILLVFNVVIPAQSATNFANNLRDDLSAGSLRLIISQSVSRDTVAFNSGLTGTIALARGPVVLDRNITVQGPGSKAIQIDGMELERVFRITNSSPTIAGLAIARGRTVGANGVSIQPGETAVGGGILILNSAAGYTCGSWNVCSWRTERRAGPWFNFVRRSRPRRRRVWRRDHE
jgi:hypothetical protein